MADYILRYSGKAVDDTVNKVGDELIENGALTLTEAINLTDRELKALGKGVVKRINFNGETKNPVDGTVDLGSYPIDSTIPAIASDERIPSTKLVKDEFDKITLSDSKKAEKTYVDQQDQAISQALNTAKTELTELANSKATPAYVDKKVSDLIGGAPATLDTLKELADALADDANFAATVTAELGKKADKATTITELSKKIDKTNILTAYPLTEPANRDTLLSAKDLFIKDKSQDNNIAQLNQMVYSGRDASTDSNFVFVKTAKNNAGKSAKLGVNTAGSASVEVMEDGKPNVVFDIPNKAYVDAEVKKTNDKITPKADKTYVDTEVKKLDDKNAQLEQELDAIKRQSHQYWYGVSRKVNTASPDMTRIGWLDNHRSLPYHNKIRPCIVRADRTIAYFLDVNDLRKKADGTSSKLDGTDGQVMVYFPAGYILINSRGSDNGNNNETYAIGLSPFSVDGDVAEYFPAFVKSIDYATVQRSTNKLMCVVNADADYAGSGSLSTSGGIGYPRTSISNYKYTEYARNLGSDWTNSFAYFEMIQTALMYIEYATYQLQKPYNTVLTTEGYKQGGLGVGPQNWNGADWSAYNGNNPVVQIGEVQLSLCAKMNQGTGIYVKAIQATPDKAYTTEFPCWRWISNLWGHLWRWDSGVDIDMYPDGDNPISVLYMTKNIRAILATSDTDFSFIEKYDRIGLIPRISSYVKSMIQGSYYVNEQAGGTTSYCCAYFWTSIPTTRERRGLRFGAYLSYGGVALRASAFSIDRPSYATASIGSGLSAYVNE